jgi:hypothetical protein
MLDISLMARLSNINLISLFIAETEHLVDCVIAEHLLSFSFLCMETAIAACNNPA